MLPAWATVAIALGGGAIGALAGVFGSYLALRVAKLNFKHQAREAWIVRMVEAAQEFVAAYTAAYWCVAKALDHERDGAGAESHVRDARDALERVSPHVVTIGLLYGIDSPATTAAGEVGRFMGDALRAVTDSSDENLRTPTEAKEMKAHAHSDARTAAEAKLDKASSRSDDFLREAFKAMQAWEHGLASARRHWRPARPRTQLR
jgi:hypothetical protein